jgi:hypothetical protein
MRVAIAAIACVACLPSSADAVFTDFSDYAQTTSFAFGEVFQSKGVALKAVNLATISFPVSVAAKSNLGEAYLLPGPGVEFVLPAGATEISFDYQDGSGRLLILNGVRPPRPGENGTPFHAGFSFLNGTTVAGVDVTTTTTFSDPHGESGRVTFRGPISDLAIAGLELLIDNVSVLVPEPSGATWLVVGMASLSRLRRRRAR